MRRALEKTEQSSRQKIEKIAKKLNVFRIEQRSAVEMSTPPPPKPWLARGAPPSSAGPSPSAPTPAAPSDAPKPWEIPGAGTTPRA